MVTCRSFLLWAHILCALLLTACFAGEARAAVTWPGDTEWIALTAGNGDNLSDPRGGTNPKQADIVGNAPTSRRGAGFWYYNSTTDQLMFRIRVDKTPLDNSSNFKNQVWTVLIDDQDGDDKKGWALQLDAKDDDLVELEAVDKLDGKLGKINIKDTNDFTGAIGTYARAVNVDNNEFGSDFGGEADFFVDIAIDFSDFETATGLSTTDNFRVALTTSDRDNKIRKDYPFDLDKNKKLFADGGWGSAFAANDAVVPEPSTWALFGLGAIVLGLRVRRRKRAADSARVSA